MPRVPILVQNPKLYKPRSVTMMPLLLQTPIVPVFDRSSTSYSGWIDGVTTSLTVPVRPLSIV